MIRILVLKDGQIIEKGNFKELLAIDGLFASMWADQVSSTDDPAHSINGKKELSGYIVESEETKQEEPQNTVETTNPITLVAELADVPDEEIVKLDVPFAVTVNEEGPLLQSETVDNVETPNTATTISATFTSSGPSATTPLQFPTAPDIPQPEIRRSDSPSGFTPAVTFGANVNSPPSRTGTPDPEGEPKRKRISSQNFQRLARRMSLTTRRQSSVSSILPNIPGLKRNDSPRTSTDDNNARAEGSTSKGDRKSVV